MAQEFNWLKDQTRADEVLHWLGGRWKIDQLEAWSRNRFGLDELKDWIDEKYPIDAVVKWAYHDSNPEAKFVRAVIEGHRAGIESHGGKISFIGLDGNTAHVAFAGACGSCTTRETATTENLLNVLRKGISGIVLIDDGPVREATGNFSVEQYTGDSPVQIRTLGREIAPTSS